MTLALPVLLFGANGQLGTRLHHALEAAGYNVTALGRAACDFATIDAKQIDAMIRTISPALIINAAAYTSVDKAETQPELAMRINGEVPEWIARAATAHTIPLIHFSTDYVFDGVRGRYAEDAPQRPLNVYGETKRVGETAVLDAGGYVFRLQWVYDVRGQNFLLTMKKLLAERDVLSVVADQVGAPSSASDIATAIVRATAKVLAHQMPAGVYHLAAAGYTSWHGFACAIADSMASATRILPITSAEYPLPATRPLDGRLDCNALAAQGITMPHWRDALNALLTENAG